MYGPNETTVKAFIDNIPTQLKDAGAARGAAWGAAWGAAQYAARGAARDAAWGAAQDAAWGAAQYAAWYAEALVVQDLISPEQFAILTQPWVIFIKTLGARLGCEEVSPFTYNGGAVTCTGALEHTEPHQWTEGATLLQWPVTVAA